MADSSDVDSDKIEDLVADVIDGFEPASPDVYSADRKDRMFDMLFRKSPRSSIHDDNYDDSDNRVAYSHEAIFDEQRNGAVNDRRIRKLSSRSWCMPEKQRDESIFRKHSDSYILYPSSSPRQEHGLHPNYFRYRNDSSADTSTLQPSRNNDIDKSQFKCPPARIFHNSDNSCDVNSSNIDYSSVPANTFQLPALSIPPEYHHTSHGNIYYRSSASSSLQSPSEERREFSPFSSPTSENTEDFPTSNESMESLRRISLDNSKTFLPSSSMANQQGSPSRVSRAQLATSPVIVIQEPAEISLNPSELSSLQPSKQVYPHLKHDLSRHVSYSADKPQRTMPRSKSAGPFPYKTPKNNGVDLLDFRKKSSLDADLDYTVVGISSENDLRRERSLTDMGSSNGIFTIEGSSAQGVMKALRKSSDQSPVRSQSQMSQQQNNTRRTKSYDKSSRDYFKRNIKLKDNRVKSTLRRHAMSGYQSHLPADFIDECTMEALSKEDVLILWKKSEIDLESRLHEVLARNRRLGLAIDYLTRRGRLEEPEEV